jgi:cyclase
MRKLFTVFFLFLMLNYAAGQDRDFSKVEIKATKVAGKVYMLQGAGGNIGALVGDDGIVMVDDQYAPLVDKIRAALKGISDKPVRFVINTHWHFDHTGGNEGFSTTSTIIAQENVRKRMQKGGVAGNGGSIRFDIEPFPVAALPIITFEHDVTIHFNGEDIRALHFPAGHTDGDSIIFFPDSNVVHLADDFWPNHFPFIDTVSGGSIKGLIQAIEQAISQLPADVKVIPGHGELSNLDDVRKYLKMLQDTMAVVEKALAQKKTLDQMKQEKLLEPWKEYSSDYITTDIFLETVVNSLTGKNTVGYLIHN